MTLSTSSAPAYDRVKAIPDWLPKIDDQRLVDTYNQVRDAFDPSAYERESNQQQSRILTAGLNAGANAAANYANRARQAGGSGMGAELIKAQGAVGAQRTAGDLALQREQFAASQREKAIKTQTDIAKTLGDLRSSYLNSIVQYATTEDATMAKFTTDQAQLAESARQFNWKLPVGGSYQTDVFGNISNLAGTPFRNPTTGTPTSDIRYAPTNRQSMTAGGIYG